jgi:lantibiotic modifying enzyme
VSYLAAAERAGEWLISTAGRSPDGWCWPVQPGAYEEVQPGVGWGTAAPTLFFTEAFRTTGDERWLAAARQGARWMENHLDECAGKWAGCGLFTGIGGWAVVLDELADAADDEAVRELAGRVLAAVAARASSENGLVHWHGLTEILWGTAGIGCLMLTLGQRYLGPRAVELAVGAGDWLLGQAEPAPDGIRWSLGPAYEAKRPDDKRRFPNFAHGAAGIGFFLARLAQVTGEERFLQGSLAATKWIMTTVRTDDDTCSAFHHDPGGTELFTLGWCHGPPGLGWLFRQLELTTGSVPGWSGTPGRPGTRGRPGTPWRTWLRRTARADSTSGIPERREPGFWDNVARCCGSAGVAEFFLDLYRLESRPEDLAFAVTLIDDLLDRAISDQDGMRWSNHEYRKPEPDLPPETTYLQGAPGIGSTLLRLHRQLAGDPWTVRWPHAPVWEA